MVAENVGHLAYGAMASACDFTTGFRETLHSSPENNSKALEALNETSEFTDLSEKDTNVFGGAIQMFSSAFSPTKKCNKFKGDVPMEFKNIKLIKPDSP